MSTLDQNNLIENKLTLKELQEGIKLEKIEDDDKDNVCHKRCKFLFDWKRFFLPLAIALPVLIYFDKLRNDIYIFSSCLVSALIICWNFPQIAKMGYTKPIYFEDLAEQNMISKKLLKKKILNNIESSKNFQYQFILLQQVFLSLTIAVIIEYASYRYKSTTLIFTEVLGLLGGLVSLYTKITKMIGRMLLKCLYMRKKEQRRKIMESMSKKKNFNKEFNTILKQNNMKKSASETKFNRISHTIIKIK
ncbi:hypothetical protein CPAV1605_918 [seawater metagenome]|uniref:Uncharacterized protein n=1 Tax=seawater metagenome TaxID=1561972 RepID=A0A5E8CII0_9ZZZZ